MRRAEGPFCNCLLPQAVLPQAAQNCTCIGKGPIALPATGAAKEECAVAPSESVCAQVTVKM